MAIVVVNLGGDVFSPLSVALTHLLVHGVWWQQLAARQRAHRLLARCSGDRGADSSRSLFEDA